MLILPIVNRNKILNVQISLKEAKKVKTDVDISEISESDIIVNGRSFLKSTFSSERDPRAIVDFIRNHFVMQNRKYSVTTKRTLDSNVCDVYEVAVPPAKMSDAFDKIYSSAILDMQKETPNVVKGKYLSLKKCEFDTVFSDEKIGKARKIVSSANKENWMMLFREEGLSEMLQILDSMMIFDCTIVSEATISLDVMLQVLNSFDKIHSKDTKSLRNYYNMALDNQDIYERMVYISKIVYDKDYELIRTASKGGSVQLVKCSEKELSQVA